MSASYNCSVKIRDLEDIRVTDIHCNDCNTDIHITHPNITYIACQCPDKMHLNVAYYEIRQEPDCEGRMRDIIFYNKHHPKHNEKV